MRPLVTLAVCALLVAPAAFAATFIVPTDDELIAKSSAIVVGNVEGSFVREAGGTIETVYEIRVERSLKGGADAQELIRIVEPGGEIGDRGVLVPGAAVYRQGERVLAFLTHDGSSAEWRTVDFTVGKFAFRTSTRGDRVLVRDSEDIVGWDRAGQPHREKVRLEVPFLAFVRDRVRGGRLQTPYEVDASTVTLDAPSTIQTDAISTNAAPFPAETYVSWVSNTPPRWPNISAGVTFNKRTDTNLSGLADGGVAAIQNGLAAWNNECASNINLIYGGQQQTASANHDGVNVVEFNDPQQRISGSWTGSGTVAITFISYSGNHTFNSRSWLNITGADVVFQDGYPGTSSSLPPAMTHELGHGIGWRHSNQDYATKGACNTATQECTSAAIMNSTVNSSYGYTLQPWDIHAAESVYPGGTCGTPPPTCTPPAITSQPASRSITVGQSTTLSVTATGTGPLNYVWGSWFPGGTSQTIPNSNSPTLTVSPLVTTTYWVVITNACGSVTSGTAVVTVTPAARGKVRGDYSGDGRADAAIFRPTATASWLIRNVITTQFGAGTDQPVPGHYNADNTYDIAVFRAGTWYIRTVGTLTFGQAGDTAVPADYDGDQIFELAVFRAGTWLIDGVGTFGFGQAGDTPVPRDYDGNGTDDIAVYRPSNSTWYIRNGLTVQFGQAGDIPVPADYDGNGTDDIAVYRPSTGQWIVRNQSTIVFGGGAGDQPAPADYTGDGTADLAVFRPSTGVWYIRGIGNFVHGQPGDIALRP